MADEDQEARFERCREYLSMLARYQLGARIQAKLDPSDLVQQTLLRAHEKKEQFRGSSTGEMLAWLRQIMANELAGVLRKFGTQGRDLAREKALQADLDASSSRLEAWLADDQTSPSKIVVRDEQLLHLAGALAQLPDDQRQAIELHHLQGLPLAQVAPKLERTEEAVVGLLYRGMKKLRQLLQES